MGVPLTELEVYKLLIEKKIKIDTYQDLVKALALLLLPEGELPVLSRGLTSGVLEWRGNTEKYDTRERKKILYWSQSIKTSGSKYDNTLSQSSSLGSLNTYKVRSIIAAACKVVNKGWDFTCDVAIKLDTPVNKWVRIINSGSNNVVFGLDTLFKGPSMIIESGISDKVAESIIYNFYKEKKLPKSGYLKYKSWEVLVNRTPSSITIANTKSQKLLETSLSKLTSENKIMHVDMILDRLAKKGIVDLIILASQVTENSYVVQGTIREATRSFVITIPILLSATTLEVGYSSTCSKYLDLEAEATGTEPDFIPERAPTGWSYVSHQDSNSPYEFLAVSSDHDRILAKIEMLPTD